ncbi:MAG: peptidylprolyl isomerase [Chakrabartia sp.]
MKNFHFLILGLAINLGSEAHAKSPAEIVAEAPANDWVEVPAEDLLVMTLPNTAQHGVRRVVIQLAPAPFAQGWVNNIRLLAQAQWWDGLAITRVQDNYVAQWGDPDGENPATARALPPGLRQMPEADYVVRGQLPQSKWMEEVFLPRNTASNWSNFYKGWPVAGAQINGKPQNWLVHCYGMVGVGRNLSPDTGTGAELYAVIGHAPRHLDRNIAVVGRVVQGIEHLSSLPRGTAALGFYANPKARTRIDTLRLVSDLPLTERPSFAVLATDSASFQAYAQARANRRDAFFNIPAGGADVCNIPVPIRQIAPQQ